METGNLSYFSQENGVYVLLAPDYESEEDISCFYNEDDEDNYEGFFDFPDSDD